MCEAYLFNWLQSRHYAPESFLYLTVEGLWDRALDFIPAIPIAELEAL